MTDLLWCSGERHRLASQGFRVRIAANPECVMQDTKKNEIN